MQYVWDSAKDELNRKKHGLSLGDGISALEDPERQDWIDDRFDYGEERIVALGLTHQGVLYVVSAGPQQDTVRIISVRKAEPNEIARYQG